MPDASKTVPLTVTFNRQFGLCRADLLSASRQALNCGVPEAVEPQVGPVA